MCSADAHFDFFAKAFVRQTRDFVVMQGQLSMASHNMRRAQTNIESKEKFLQNKNLTFRLSSALRFCILTGIFLLFPGSFFPSSTTHRILTFISVKLFLIGLSSGTCLSRWTWAARWFQPRSLLLLVAFTRVNLPSLPPSITPDESSKIKQDIAIFKFWCLSWF